MYFNEFEPYPAQWIQNLHPESHVDQRSIEDVSANDVQRFKRCHFFAGVAGWEYALELAEWPKDKPVWSGSCPCPPFSSAGKKKACRRCDQKSLIPCPRRTGYFICWECGHADHYDERHLWPELWRLIRDAKPTVVFGEQVSGRDGAIWFAGVRASLERIGYSVGAADLPAACVGAPHIRQRLFWVASLANAPSLPRAQHVREQGRRETGPENGSICDRDNDGLADSQSYEYHRSQPNGFTAGKCRLANDIWLDDSNSGRHHEDENICEKPRWDNSQPWRSDKCTSVDCRDGKTRRIPSIESGIQPLAYGIPRGMGKGRSKDERLVIRSARSSRVGQIKGYGNAIVPHVAAKFIRAFMEYQNV